MKHLPRVHCRTRRFPVNLARMRFGYFPLLALLCAATPALAQITVDLHALDALPGTRPAPGEATPKATRQKSEPRRVLANKPSTGSPEQSIDVLPPVPPAASPPTGSGVSPTIPAPTPTPPAATIPVTPPPVVALAPIAPPPPSAEPAPPPPPPPVSDAAASAAIPSAGGLTVTFGSGQTDLSPASAAAIQGLVKNAPTGDSTSFNVVAYAAGTPDDPSTARRLSLSRALAVRSALMANGVGSSRVYVRALGTPKEGDADRVDLSVLGANADAGKGTQQ
jgi:outer membrane protein OmpA-like peptidoglycan-associated protein